MMHVSAWAICEKLVVMLQLCERNGRNFVISSTLAQILMLFATERTAVNLKILPSSSNNLQNQFAVLFS